MAQRRAAFCMSIWTLFTRRSSSATIPSLRGKPVVVGGGTTNRGVVAAASYEARGIRYSIRDADGRGAVGAVRGLLRVQAADVALQAAFEAGFRASFGEFTPLVEGLSLDEAFLDVTASVALFGSPVEIARSHQTARSFETTGLTASVGVAENKLVAKIASDLDKPDGLTIVLPGDYEARLDPLPVSVIPGIGRETLKRLSRHGDQHGPRSANGRRPDPGTCLRPLHAEDARACGGHRRSARRGIAARKNPSAPRRPSTPTSSGREDMERELLRLSERVATRLRRATAGRGYGADQDSSVGLQDLYAAARIQPPANGTDQIYAIACDLLGTWLASNPDARIRLLGVGGSDLAPAAQPDLFAAARDGNRPRRPDGRRDSRSFRQRTFSAARGRLIGTD